MLRRVLVVVLTLALLFAPVASATPVFDCTKSEIRQQYPAQCPELPDPLLTGGGGTVAVGPVAAAGCAGSCAACSARSVGCYRLISWRE